VVVKWQVVCFITEATSTAFPAHIAIFVLGVIALANAIPDMEALSVINLAENNLGALVLPEGWTEDYNSHDNAVYTYTDGRKQDQHPGKPEGLIAIANAIPDMGAISSVNLLENDIPIEQAQELVKIMQSKEKLTTLCGLSNKEETKLDFSSQNLGAGDAMLIANDISDMRALSVLSLKDNRLLTAESAKILSDMVATNTVLKELDLSSNDWKDGFGRLKGDSAGFAQELAVGISSNNGTLMKLTFGDEQVHRREQVVTMTTEMTEANFSGKFKSHFSGKFKSHEAQIVAAFLPKCT
jgi:hypothetical protein